MQVFFAHHNIKPQKIAVAVSGGADSLALALMAKEELTVFGFEIIALTVNHNLRKNSTAEADYVASVMQAHGIAHYILEWNEVKPQTSIEEAARTARYTLLTDWCKQNNVKILLTAHHQTDQAETFLMRLQRGSGLEGLCCMREVSENNGVTIARPLLHTSPDTLRQYLQQRHIKWVEDESNTDTKFLRNRIRAFLPQLETIAEISPQTLAQTAARLQSAEEYIETQVAQILTTDVQTLTTGVFCFKHTDFIKWHREIKFRMIAALCRRKYIPRAEHILNAIDAISRMPFTGLTLGGKEIFSAYGHIWIVPELSAKRKASRQAWEDFLLQNPQYRNRKIPHKARVAILQQTEKNYDL